MTVLHNKRTGAILEIPDATRLKRDAGKQVVRIPRDLAKTISDRAAEFGLTRDALVTIVLQEYVGVGLFDRKQRLTKGGAK